MNNRNIDISAVIRVLSAKVIVSILTKEENVGRGDLLQRAGVWGGGD